MENNTWKKKNPENIQPVIRLNRVRPGKKFARLWKLTGHNKYCSTEMITLDIGGF